MAIVIGHRGACGYEPENTLLSFKKAMDMGADMIELDVHLCKTGQLVVIHDFSLQRTTSGKGLVKNKTLKQLKELNAGKGQNIPVLKEVFDLVNRKAKINIELKGANTAKKTIKLIKEYIKNHKWGYEDFIVSSFNYKMLKEARNIDSRIKIGVLFERYSPKVLETAKKVCAYAINPPKDLINRKMAEAFHKNNYKVFVWTINTVPEIKKVLSIGVDGIFTNYPDRMLEALDKYK
jgi:glycerophosphoryl diester phosphodiesterase